MSVLTIAPFGSSVAPTFAPTLASLPLTYGPTGPEERADVCVIDGSGGWAVTALDAVKDGARKLVVSNPSIVDSADARALRDAAASASAAVEFADVFAGDPAIETHREELAAHLQPTSVIVLTQVLADVSPAAATFGALRVMRALGCSVQITAVTQAPASIAVHGIADGKVFLASVARSKVEAFTRVQGLGFTKTLDVILRGASDARPAEIVVTSMAGGNQLPTIYETPERAAWRRIAISEDSSGLGALDGVIEDLEQAEAA